MVLLVPQWTLLILGVPLLDVSYKNRTRPVSHNGGYHSPPSFFSHSYINFSLALTNHSIERGVTFSGILNTQRTRFIYVILCIHFLSFILCLIDDIWSVLRL